MKKVTRGTFRKEGASVILALQVLGLIYNIIKVESLLDHFATRKSLLFIIIFDIDIISKYIPNMVLSKFESVFIIKLLDKISICVYYCISSIIQCGEKMKSDFDNNIPIYFQLVEQLKRDIISGKISAGERIPSVRDLALQLKVNPNTVQKALVELENIGLIFTERTNGKFVTEDNALIQKHKQEYADKITQKYIQTMEKIGFDKKGILLLIKGLGGNK